MFVKPLCLTTLLAAASALALTASAAELQLKRVMLSSGGVGYFEYQAEVDGWETMEIPVRLDQVDDVLKSAVIFDDDGGSGTIELQGKDSLREIFRTMPIGPDAFDSPAALYTALQGEEVSVEDPISATGRIVSVVEETDETTNGTTKTRHRMSIMTASGLVQFVLEDARGIKFTNEDLDAKVTGALTAISGNRQRELRTLKVTARGDGSRTVTVGFVIEAPLWKTSYRLVAGNEGKARMQGWAIIENASGADWKDVELTLVSGNPVTFRQALYDKYYVDRTSVPVEVLGRVNPRRDEGSYKSDADEEESDGMGTPIEPAPAPAPTTMPPEGPAPAQVVMETQEGWSEDVDVSGSNIPERSGEVATESKESATQVVFTFANAVTAGSGQSLTVPILDREVPAERISLYQPATHDTHPLASLKLTNDTDTGLPPGIVTLFDNASGRTIYAGDAVLGVLPLGEKRILSFALDQKVLIDQDYKQDEQVSSVKIVNGVMEAKELSRRTYKYTAKGASAEDRSVVIETPKLSWELKSQDPNTVEVAGSYLRIPMLVPAGQTATLEVVWEQTRTGKIALLDQIENLDPDEVLAGLSQAEAKGLPESVRAAFAHMAELKANQHRIEQQIEQAEAERERIYKEQERIRENLKSVPEGSDLQRRYLATLATQEDRLAQIEQQLQQLQAELTAAKQALVDYVSTLNL